MPYLTTRENLKLQLSPGLVASYDIQPGNGVGLFRDTKHTHIYLLTYLLSLDPHGETRGGKNIEKHKQTQYRRGTGTTTPPSHTPYLVNASPGHPRVRV